MGSGSEDSVQNLTRGLALNFYSELLKIEHSGRIEFQSFD